MVTLFVANPFRRLFSVKLLREIGVDTGYVNLELLKNIVPGTCRECGLRF
jgi:hypothetical protein